MLRRYRADLFQELSEPLAWLIGIFLLINVFGGIYYIKTDLMSGIAISIAILVGFVFHELAHRTVANKLGCNSRFSIDAFSVLITSIIALLQNVLLVTTSRGLPFIIALPGFVMSYCFHLRKDLEGVIAFAGPATNILISIISLLIASFVPSVRYLGEFISRINSMLALFNLLPIHPLDGYKVIRWNIFIWTISLMITLVLLIA
jgi:Zn-dependent protease